MSIQHIFPDLIVDNTQQLVQQGGDHIAALDGGMEPPRPELVEDSSDDEDDGEGPCQLV